MVHPPNSNFSAPPGSSMTPSSDTNSLTTILLIVVSSLWVLAGTVPVPHLPTEGLPSRSTRGQRFLPRRSPPCHRRRPRPRRGATLRLVVRSAPGGGGARPTGGGSLAAHARRCHPRSRFAR